MSDDLPFIGQRAAWNEWLSALDSERMHHAWLLAGSKGLGKAAFARTAAAQLVRNPGEPRPDPEMHPDIHILEHLPANDDEAKKKAEGKPYQTKRNISVDQVREMIRRLVTKPTMGDRRAIIIDPADDLETSAVNALLKSLEEPPVGTYFLLVTHRLGRLLPTIRSRCRILRFSPLSDGAVDNILKAQAPQADGPTRAAAVAAAQGSPGVALDFVHEELAAAHQLMGRILAEGDAGMMLRGLLAEELGARPKRERLSAVLDLARAVLAADLRSATPRRQARLIEAHGAMVKLAREAPIYNYDPGLLAMEIGALLASSAVPTEAGNR